jgi:Glu-tRNA(Gln) amidotransferase subunit E-like FAD-binding protein
LQYATHQEFNQILNEVWKIKPADYVALFATELEKKFSDYSVAYLNKQQALQLAKEEQERRLQEIAQQKQQTEIAATLDSVSTDMSIEPSGLKALKKAYEVDMPETFDSVMKIFSAFMANKQKCLEKVNIKNGSFHLMRTAQQRHWQK